MNSGLDLHYERVLGEGSYGKVFLVKQDDGDKFAVKEIELRKCDDKGRDQANAEAHLLSRLKHENILRYVESVINEDCLYIVTEFCEGGDLEDYLQLLAKKGMTAPESLISEWILQLGEALKYLHDMKILHRDMKSKNIFLKRDLTAKLGDLGIAKVLDLNQSKADTFIGTPSYMSPELFTGKSYNHKTDIWGLGCCVYEMMTLKRAFQGRALWTLIREIKKGHLLEMPDTYSLETRTLVQGMMAQKPEERPSAKDIVQNDLLLYHRGAAKQHIQNGMPLPGQNDSKTKPKSANNNNSGSGSLLQVIQQMNKSVEDKFRTTIESVCGKINTLRLTQEGTQEEQYDTFVYKGDSDDSDCDLEAEGTILDKSLLKQYTEQLETFVFKGFDENVGESDSDYFTGGSIGKEGLQKSKVGDGKEGGEDDEDESSRTLLRQYSQTLAVDDGDGDDDDGDDDNDGTIVPSNSKCWQQPKLSPKQAVRKPLQSETGAKVNKAKDKTTNQKGKNVPVGAQGSALGLLESDDDENDAFEETVELGSFSKYKYSGLKDTLALRKDKRKTRTKSDPNEWFTPPSKTDSSPLSRSLKSKSETEESAGKVVTNLENGVVKSPKKQKSVRLALSSTGEFNSMTQKEQVPRLMKTMDESLTSKSRAPKVPVCDRIEQTVKSKSANEKRRVARNEAKSKGACMDKAEGDTNGAPDSEDLDVEGVMSHLREHITPISSIDTHSEPVKQPPDDSFYFAQDFSPNKGKKKKESYLKKQSEARKKSVDSSASKNEREGSGEIDIKLFTRAQTAKFSKSHDDEDSSASSDSEEEPSNPMYSGSQEEARTQQIITVQQKLAEGLGYEKLRELLQSMSVAGDDTSFLAYCEATLGLAQYKTHRQLLKRLLRLEKYNEHDLTAETL